MSYETFIPQLWAADIHKAFQTRLVYGQAQIVNRRYEGMIRQRGDTVSIQTVSDPTIRTHTRGTNIAAPEAGHGASQVLRISEEKYFNITIPDIDRVQADPGLFEEYTGRGGYGLAKTMDSFIASTLAAGVASANELGSTATPLVPTADTAYEYLVDLDTLLSENDVPEEGRYSVVPHWFHGLLRKDDRFVSFGTAPNQQVLRGRPVGEAANLTVYRSNQVPNTAGVDYRIIAGHAEACTFAEQMTATPEAYRPELRFEDAIKELHAYGARVTRPYSIAVLHANRS